ncbi:MAG: hypothetical protein IK031_06615 [Bacteroidales bacterium]|nr:hypothetical protein [Bacteroidales bacterium]
MTIQEAIIARHSVRQYIDKPIEAVIVETLRAETEKLNAKSGLNVQLVLDEPKCFSTGMWKYGRFSGVKNYLVMAGPKGKEAEERIGYYGEKLVLLAKTLFSPWGYTFVDLGIVKCHFEVGAGKDSFTWLTKLVY